jgi:hypothetical protein
MSQNCSGAAPQLEFPYFYRSSGFPQGSRKILKPQQRAASHSIHFASGTQSSGTVTTPGAVTVSVRTEHVQLECFPKLIHQTTEEKIGCELA